MKKILLATAALSLMCGSAFAQNTGPAPQTDNMQKPGMHSTDKGARHNGTTGMSNGTAGGMVKGGTLPDASGQGGSGPGSDQGGTRVAPGNMK
jgi:hypothetical protein